MIDRGAPLGQPGVPLPAPAAPAVSRARQFRETLAELGRLGGIRGGLIVTPDGLVITARLPASMAAEPLAALAATLGRELETTMDELGRGSFRTALFSADDGTLFVGGSPVGYVVLVSDAAADTEAVLAALRNALTHLSGAWR
jgi:predicted regulator of Ras-like GTPase activity (Roadblock/LC7/MglB family)